MKWKISAFAVHVNLAYILVKLHLPILQSAPSKKDGQAVECAAVRLQA